MWSGVPTRVCGRQSRRRVGPRRLVARVHGTVAASPSDSARVGVSGGGSRSGRHESRGARRRECGAGDRHHTHCAAAGRGGCGRTVPPRQRRRRDVGARSADGRRGQLAPGGRGCGRGAAGAARGRSAVRGVVVRRAAGAGRGKRAGGSLRRGPGAHNGGVGMATVDAVRGAPQDALGAAALLLEAVQHGRAPAGERRHVGRDGRCRGEYRGGAGRRGARRAGNGRGGVRRGRPVGGDMRHAGSARPVGRGAVARVRGARCEGHARDVRPARGVVRPIAGATALAAAADGVRVGRCRSGGRAVVRGAVWQPAVRASGRAGVDGVRDTDRRRRTTTTSLAGAMSAIR